MFPDPEPIEYDDGLEFIKPVSVSPELSRLICESCGNVADDWDEHCYECKGALIEERSA